MYDFKEKFQPAEIQYFRRYFPFKKTKIAWVDDIRSNYMFGFFSFSQKKNFEEIVQTKTKSLEWTVG